MMDRYLKNKLNHTFEIIIVILFIILFPSLNSLVFNNNNHITQQSNSDITIVENNKNIDGNKIDKLTYCDSIIDDQNGNRLYSPTLIYTRANGNNSQPYFTVNELPQIELTEDFGIYSLNLTNYAADNEDPPEALHWFITGDNKSLINVTNENSTDQRILLRSVTNAYGNGEMKLWVSDTTGRMDFKILRIMINPKNDFPKISALPTLFVHSAKPYSINLEPYIVDYDTPVTNIDIKVKAEGSDREFATISNNILKLDFKSTTEFNKDYITLELNDKINVSFAKIEINLTTNFPPEQLRAIPDIVLYHGEPLKKILDLDYYFYDPDHDRELLLYDYLKGEHLKVNINDDNTVDLDVINKWEGIEKIVMRCKDPIGAFKEQIVNITVAAKHLSIGLLPLPDLKVHYNFEYTFNLTPYIQLEDMKIKYSIEIFEFINNIWIKNTDLANIKLISGNNVILKINYSEYYLNRTIPIFIYITDGESKFFQEFLIKVTNNYPPIQKKFFTDLTFDEDTSIQSAFDLYEYFSDIEVGILEFSNITENIISDIKVNGIMTIKSKPDWFGTERIIIRAHDIFGAIVEDSFLITVVPINDPPKILNIPEVNVTLGVLETFEFVKYLEDVDNNISELKVEVDSEHITLAGGLLIFKFPSNYGGRRSFTLTVSDGEHKINSEVTMVFKSPVKGTGKEAEGASPLIFWGMILILILMIIALLVIGMVYINRQRSFRFDEIFLIYKDGLLIAHASRSKKSSQDSDIISSMFTAVQDFIHDSFSDPDRAPESWPLKRLDFGDFKIVIDRGDYIYISAVFSGFPLKNKLVQIEKLRKEIEKKYADILPTWTGDMEHLIGTQELIEKLLYSTGPPRSDKIEYSGDTDGVVSDDEEIAEIDDEFRVLENEDELMNDLDSNDIANKKSD